MEHEILISVTEINCFSVKSAKASAQCLNSSGLTEWMNNWTNDDRQPSQIASCIHSFVESPPLRYRGFASKAQNVAKVMGCHLWKQLTKDGDSHPVHAPSVVFSLALIEQPISSCPLERPTEQGAKDVLLPVASESSRPPETNPPNHVWVSWESGSFHMEPWRDCSSGQHLVVACERPTFTKMFEL